jgi:hypothetical protein
MNIQDVEAARASFTALKLFSERLLITDHRMAETNEHLDDIALGLANLNEQMERLAHAAEKAGRRRTTSADVAEWVLIIVVASAALAFFGAK